jgi:hypothetical protein
MGTTWQGRAEQWRRFSAWEDRRLRDAPPELGETLVWMAEAYDLARRASQGWGSGLDLEHTRQIGLARAALARMKLPA